MKPQNIRSINPDSVPVEPIAEAADIIQTGGVAVIPTRGLYGLAADAFNPAAVHRIFEIKKRPHHKPLSIFIGNIKSLEDVAVSIPPAGRRLIDRFWPGGITIIFKAAPRLPVELTAGSGKIGIRLPGHSVASALAAAVKNPITATSANLSGHDGCWAIEQLHTEIADAAGIILDAGRLEGGAGSTVIDVTGNPSVILREGAVSADRIHACLAE